nr:TIGR00366 family protein [uncultured Fusobacterium sp.]
MERRSFKMPHSYVIIFSMLVLAFIMGNVIDAGEYERIANEAGKMVVIPGSYHKIENIGMNLFDFFMSIQDGFVKSANIIFFVIFAYSFVYMIIKNGTFDAVVGFLLRKVGRRIELIIPIGMIVFGILGSTMGLYEETYGLIPVFMAIASVIGYDAIVGSSIIYLGVAVGFASATINPFTIGVAQQVAGVPLFSGIGYRIFCFIIFMTISIIYVWRYAHKIKDNPTKSLLYGIEMETVDVASKDELMQIQFTNIHRLSCLMFLVTIGVLMYGTISKGWYIDEISTLFIIMTIVTGLISRFSPSQIATYFIEAAKDMMFGALIIGLSYSMPVVMEKTKIIDTIINFLVGTLNNFSGVTSAIGMLFVQNIINLFIPSGGGQALVTMPILAPVGEMVGLSRQLTVLAYQFGDGYSNIFWPTSVFSMCGIMRMPVNKWYSFVTPLFGMMFIAQIILIIIAVIVRY